MTSAPLVHGELCYLQIPAADVAATASFYEAVFGWKVELGYASFEAPGMIGQFTTDRAPAGDGGILGWIHVERIEAALALVREHGGEPLEEPYADGPVRTLATVRDPGGNVIGVVEHRGGR